MEEKNVRSDSLLDLYETLNAIVAFWDVSDGSGEMFIRLLRDSQFIEYARTALARARGEA